MASYTRPGRFDFTARGIDVNTPVDRLRDRGKFPILKNVIVGTDGTVESRPGLVNRYSSYAAITAKSPVLSFKRINDTSTGSLISTLLQGVGDVIAYEQSSAAGTLAVADAGPYSTNPLSITLYRPPRAVQPWAYIGDSSRMRKIRYDTPSATIQVHRCGLPAPTVEPIAVPSTGVFKTIDLFEPAGGGTGYTRWTAGGGGVIVGATAGQRVNAAISNVLFEAYTGYDQISLIQPASMAGINVGAVLHAVSSSVEDILVTQINKPSSTLTISRILYDSGTSGLCSLILSNSPREITVNSMLWNSTIGEYVRVRSINLGADGTASYRVSTVNTWAATNSVATVGSFVCNALSNHVGGALNSNAMSVTIPGGVAPATFSQTIALDLTQLLGTSVAQPTTLDDYVTIALRFDFPALVTEVKLFFDFDSAISDFAHNYYYRALSPSDLTPVTTDAQSALDNRRTQASRSIIERVISRHPFLDEEGDEARSREPNNANLAGPGGGEDPPRTQLDAGTSQWSQIRFRLSDLQRIGSDESRGLRNVAAIRISVIATSAITMDVDSWVVHGGFAPDVVEPASGYQYAYRARVSSTGAVSDLSPLSRGPANAVRQRVSVVLSQYTTASEADYLDIFRIGGSLPDIAYVGSTANTASPVFLDTYTDTSVFARADANGTFDLDDPDLALWPDLDIPRSGTATAVAGTTVQSSTQFNTSWAPGTLITIDGIPTTVYRMISTSLLEVVDNLGSRANVSWVISDPVLIGQNLPILAGPYQEHLLACGSTRNPGSLYYTKAKNVDSTSRRRRLEITDNSDRLQNIFVFNGRGGVFSTQRLYYLEYNPLDQFSIFSATESPNVKGLYARWAMAVGRRGVAWLAADGVYLMEGGGAKNLTDVDLRPLFPLGGKQGVDTNGISAPYMPNPVGAEERYLRLMFDENDNLRFVYRDSGGNMRCLLYDFSLEGWLPLVYQKPVTIFYSEEGPGVRNLIAGTSETTGRTLTVGGPSDVYTDDGASFPCQVRTPSMDFGDPRSQKQIGDIEIDINPGNASVTVQAGFDNFATTVSAITLTGSARINPPSLYDLSSGSGQFARNVALDFSWTNAANQKPILYLWEPSYLSHPEDSQLRASDYEFSSPGLLYVKGIWVSANTASVNRTVVLDYIDHLGASQTTTITVNHPVKSRIYYPISPIPVYASTLRCRPTDAGKWKFYGFELNADPAPPFTVSPTPFDDGDDPTAKFLQGCRIKLDTHNTIISYQVQGDAGAVLAIITGLSCALPSVIAVPFNPAVRTHLMRLVPLQPVHTFGVEWDWQSEPELVNYYEGQETSLDLPGYKHIREVYVAYAFASQPLTLSLYLDGSPTPLAGVPALPASTAYIRRRILIPAKKFKAVKPVLSSSANFRPYSRDCAVYFKGWGEDGDYRVMELFGTQHRDRGIAKI